MKFNWKKLINPNNIDFDELNRMSPEQQKLSMKEIYKSELTKIWLTFTYTTNYMCMTGTWQYIVALWIY